MNEFKQDIEAISRIPVTDKILEVICRTTGMGFATIARVTEDRWIACAVQDNIDFGLLPGGELKVEMTICHEVCQSGNMVVIDHVDEDEVYVHHPIPSLYGLQSYISVPIVLKNGEYFGTLCAVDTHPAKLNNPETIGMFTLFADLIAMHLQTLQQIVDVETALQEERQIAEVREQFIAILGHDLLNPLGAVYNSAQLLLRMPLKQKEQVLAKMILKTSKRMKALIDNMLDFARGRLGGGFVLDLKDNEKLEAILNQVVQELRAIWPNREIQTDFSLSAPVICDEKRIAQLFSNLLGNALTHDKSAYPIKVEAKSELGKFSLSVSNRGEQIPPDIMGSLFKPFARNKSGVGKPGLGLGLYIAYEIAKAHGGALNVVSNPSETRFTLTIDK